MAMQVGRTSPGIGSAGRLASHSMALPRSPPPPVLRLADDGGEDQRLKVGHGLRSDPLSQAEAPIGRDLPCLGPAVEREGHEVVARSLADAAAVTRPCGEPQGLPGELAVCSVGLVTDIGPRTLVTLQDRVVGELALAEVKQPGPPFFDGLLPWIR